MKKSNTFSSLTYSATSFILQFVANLDSLDDIVGINESESFSVNGCRVLAVMEAEDFNHYSIKLSYFKDDEKPFLSVTVLEKRVSDNMDGFSLFRESPDKIFTPLYNAFPEEDKENRESSALNSTNYIVMLQDAILDIGEELHEKG